jgi:oligoribonuclease
MNRSKYLVWVDLEMTGLDHNHDLILEVAVLVTDAKLNIVAQGPEFVLHASPAKIASMTSVVHQMHTESGLIPKVLASQVTVQDAEAQILTFLKKYGEPRTMPLCGNSIWQDKLFLIKYMPKLVDFLHYRIIDVSTIKELVKNWYSDEEFKKAKKHRALEDIYESIQELLYYQQKYFIKEV